MQPCTHVDPQIIRMEFARSQCSWRRRKFKKNSPCSENFAGKSLKSPGGGKREEGGGRTMRTMIAVVISRLDREGIRVMLSLLSADNLFLKHDSSILRQSESSNPVCGFSMMVQVRLFAVWSTENWLCSSMNHIQGWMTV